MLFFLFTSIPLQFAYDNIKENYQNYSTCFSSDLDVVLNLTKFSFESNCFEFNSNFYKQINGTAIESPAPICIAEIVTLYIKKLITSQFNNKILFWHLYVDDIFILADAYYLKDILAYANTICLSSHLFY